MLVYMLFPLVHAANRVDFRSFNQILSVPYFPMQIVTGLIAGYAAQVKYKSRFACWVWVLPLAEFVVHFASFSPPSVLQDSWSARVAHFLGTGCRPPFVLGRDEIYSKRLHSICVLAGCLRQRVGTLFAQTRKSRT
jgi:hypothetical protein